MANTLAYHKKVNLKKETVDFPVIGCSVFLFRQTEIFSIKIKRTNLSRLVEPNFFPL